jgi:V8-like Glu-specific endopeptidase
MPDIDLPPLPSLSPPEREEIMEAIVDGYTAPDLTRVLYFKWGMKIENYVDLHQGFYDVVTSLIKWTEQRGKTLELLTVAYAENTGNPRLKQAAQAHGISREEVTQKYDLSQPPPPRPSLEAAVNKHSRLIDYGRFLRRFANLGDRICRIEHPDKLGTGFLVGPDLLLTNFHVVSTTPESIDTAKVARTVCRFDYQEDRGGKTYRLRAEPVASRPYSQSDITGTGEPAANELDYALLQLSEAVGKTAAGSGGIERGWFPLSSDPLLALRDFVVVPQHPDGRHLEVAWGTALAFNSNLTRVRHDVTTDFGSSGSPCFTFDLELFGLHHASDPKTNPKFNQAIPLTRIAEDLAARGVAV